MSGNYVPLYRKYRPVSFDDFVGQNEVSKIIKNEKISFLLIKNTT